MPAAAAAAAAAPAAPPEAAAAAAALEPKILLKRSDAALDAADACFRLRSDEPSTVLRTSPAACIQIR